MLKLKATNQSTFFMGALNRDFRYPKSFQFFIGLIFILFLAMFAYTMALVMGVFDTEYYSSAVASIGVQGNY